MDRDDETVGRVLSRRDAVRVLGASGLLFVPGARAWARAARGEAGVPPACVVRPQQTAGPYFVDTGLHRSDIRTDPSNGAVADGIPLALGIAVAKVTREACVPLPGAHVEVWQCDAAGVYSGVKDKYFDTVGRRFLRGYQRTDAQGLAQFVTIYPGWYPERTVHIHFKIRTEPAADRGHEFTSQLYFDDALSDEVFRRAPYAARGRRPIRNADDGIFAKAKGDQLILSPTKTATGYEGVFPIGLVLDT